jgi:diketogulonate reductase-like aldo/keto reductase
MCVAGRRRRPPPLPPAAMPITTTTVVTHPDGTSVTISTTTSATAPAAEETTLTGFLPETYVEGFHDPELVRKMKYRRLSPCTAKGGGPMHVSILSFGASSLGGCFRDDTTAEEGVKVVLTALKAGINLIDVAAWYGHGLAEKVLGMALKDVPREAYYINTKCCRYQPDILEMFDFSTQRTLQSIDESIERMGCVRCYCGWLGCSYQHPPPFCVLSLPHPTPGYGGRNLSGRRVSLRVVAVGRCGYLDTIQIHDPEYAPKLHGLELSDPECIIYKETLPAMQQAKDAGKVRFIGITGFPLAIHKDLIKHSPVKIDTCLSYCHYSMNDTSLGEHDHLELPDELPSVLSLSVCVLAA